jgi:hypothetical protein
MVNSSSVALAHRLQRIAIRFTVENMSLGSMVSQGYATPHIYHLFTSNKRDKGSYRKNQNEFYAE